MLDLEISRRRLLVGSACLVAATLLPTTAHASRTAPARMLRFYNPNTGERASACWENGRYIHDGLQEFSWLFRDHRAGDLQIPIDAKLFDQLLEHLQKDNKPYGKAYYGGYLADLQQELSDNSIPSNLVDNPSKIVKDVALEKEIGNGLKDYFLEKRLNTTNR